MTARDVVMVFSLVLIASWTAFGHDVPARVVVGWVVGIMISCARRKG